jgi:hypothetical protein
MYFSFYINFPTTSNGSPSYGILQNNVTFDLNYWFYQNGVTFDLNYWFYQNGVVTGSSSNSGSTATFSSPIGNGQLTNLVGIFGLTNIQATFHVAIFGTQYSCTDLTSPTPLLSSSSVTTVRSQSVVT